MKKCDYCGCTEYEEGEARTTGGFLTKLFDIQTNKFKTVTCRQCGHTVFFKQSSSMAGNVLDFFMQ